MTEGDIAAGVKALRQALDEATRAQTGLFKVDYNKHVSDAQAERGVYLVLDAVDKHRASKKVA
jgi:hypothetical protein